MLQEGVATREDIDTTMKLGKNAAQWDAKNKQKINNQQPTINNQQPTINNQKSTNNNSQSTTTGTADPMGPLTLADFIGLDTVISLPYSR